mgnify:CR=1 FL=1
MTPSIINSETLSDGTRVVIASTCGVCSQMIRIEVKNDKVQSVQFFGGCHGNGQGVAALCRGMKVSDVTARLKGIRCGDKRTSCPDQLAQILEQMNVTGK